ncbi:MAG TPA: hypothetical protein PKC24_01545 [Cyclobacteriaceae bacterium]|nr:hypothetical protein [Cyclobacteriaceae bacterium]
MNQSSKLRTVVFILFLICCNNLIQGQALPDVYYEDISLADSMIIHKNFKAAALHYDAVFKKYEGRGTLFNRYIAAYLWNNAGNLDSCFYYLNQLADEGSFYTIRNAIGNKSFENLYEDERWMPLVRKILNNKILLSQTVPDEYISHQLHGFEVLINKSALYDYQQTTDSALMQLKKDLLKITKFKMTKSALDSLRTVRIFIDWDTGHHSLQVHNNEDWLIQNGYILEKTNQMEISNIKNYMAYRNQNQPYVVMHEMTHAFHNRLSEADKVLIKNTYEKAMQKNLYQSVRYHHGDGNYESEVPAYAGTDEFEYFAEITVAYFGLCNFYPFNRKDLKKYDNAGYKLVRLIWLKDR